MTDPLFGFKLGRLHAVHPIGYKSISAYGDLPEAPPTFDHTNGWNGFQILGNGPDPTLTVNNGQPMGDCGVVGTVNVSAIDAIATGLGVVPAGAIEANPSSFEMPTSNVVATEYLKYDKGQDVGVSLTDFLNFWYTFGLPWAKPPEGYASLNFQDLDEYYAGVSAWTCAYIGISVTKAMMEQTQRGEPWQVSLTGNEVIGGHCVVDFVRTSDGGEVATWGMRQPYTKGWFKKHVEEAHVVITTQQVTAKGNGYDLDLEQLKADLGKI